MRGLETTSSRLLPVDPSLQPLTCSRCCRGPSALDSTSEERVRKAFSVDHHGPGDARLSHIRVVLRVPTASKATMRGGSMCDHPNAGDLPLRGDLRRKLCALPCPHKCHRTATHPFALAPSRSKHSCARAGCRAIALGGGDCRRLRVRVFLPEVREFIRDTKPRTGRRPPI